MNKRNVLLNPSANALTMLLSVVAIAFVCLMNYLYPTTIGIRTYNRIYFPGMAILIFGILFFGRRRLSFSSTLGTLPSTFYVLGGWLLAVLIQGLFVTLLDKFDPETYSAVEGGAARAISNVAVKKVTPITVHDLIVNVAFAAIAEEIICRFGLLTSMRRYIGQTAAVIISSLLFTVAHLDSSPNPMILVPIFFTGVILAITYLALGLRWAMILHAFNNLMPMLRNAELLNHDSMVIILVVAAIGMCFFILRSAQFFMGRKHASQLQ